MATSLGNDQQKIDNVKVPVAYAFGEPLPSHNAPCSTMPSKTEFGQTCHSDPIRLMVSLGLYA